MIKIIQAVLGVLTGKSGGAISTAGTIAAASAAVAGYITYQDVEFKFTMMELAGATYILSLVAGYLDNRS